MEIAQSFGGKLEENSPPPPIPSHFKVPYVCPGVIYMPEGCLIFDLLGLSEIEMTLPWVSYLLFRFHFQLDNSFAYAPVNGNHGPPTPGT